ncbi:MAG: penicillin-binding protein activator [Burkholderiaceae bacterium]
MSINRRQVLRVVGQGFAAFGAQAGFSVSDAFAANKQPAGTEEEQEEEKKKSTLVSNVEEFGRGRTRIALLLPNIEGPFRFAADAVLRGIIAAHAVDGKGVYVKVFRIEDPEFADAREVYRQLQRERFQLAIGPLIRSELNGLARMPELPIPTLGLNLPDQGREIPLNCALFSLAVEFDGRSAARFAFAEAYQRVGNQRPLRALAISDTKSLSQRSADAFTEGWQAYGGETEAPIVRNIRSKREMSRLLSGIRADVVFAAVDPLVMGKVRSAFSSALPIYGTSQLNVGALPTVPKAELLAAPELDGVRVVEMPWQLMPDHPAVAAYRRSRRLPHMEMQRLYAFGIDAWRLARGLLAQAEQGLGAEPISLDGVTGRLYLDLNLDPRVSREPVLGVYRRGILQPAYASEAQAQPGESDTAQPTKPAPGTRRHN